MSKPTEIVKSFSDKSCEAKCLLLIAVHSPVYYDDPNKFYDIIDAGNAKLGTVEISDSKADRQLRVIINHVLNTNHAQGSFSSNNNIDTILRDSCVNEG